MELNAPEIGTARAGSEPFGSELGSASRGGRRPFLSDQALLETTRELNLRLERLPTAAELIEAVGACQKQRALRAIQQIRVELAEKAVRAHLVIPSALRNDLDDFARRLLDRAAEQLSEKQAQADLENEQKLLLAREEIEQLVDQVQMLRGQLADKELRHQALLIAQQKLRSELDEAIGRAHRVTAVAEERQRLLVEFLQARPAPSMPSDS